MSHSPSSLKFTSFRKPRTMTRVLWWYIRSTFTHTLIAKGGLSLSFLAQFGTDSIADVKFNQLG